MPFTRSPFILDPPVRFTRSSALKHDLPVLPITDLTPRRSQPQSNEIQSSDEDSDFESTPFFGSSLPPFQLPRRIALPKPPLTLSTTIHLPLSATTPTMASKIIPAFTGPLTPPALETWLGQCEDGFAIYTATKSSTAAALEIATKIRLTGTQLQEPTMQAWWSAGRTEFLKLATWGDFEKRIRERFMPKGYKLIALRAFFLCSQGRLQFTDYATTLAEARNAISVTVVSNTTYKHQLLFHSHPILLLRIMAIPDFDLDNISFDNLTSLMAMQWDSLLAENSTRRTVISSNPSPSAPISSPISNRSASLPFLDDAEKARLTAARGCWNCRKVPSDPGWVAHVSRLCPGDTLLGIRPGRDFVSNAPSSVKQEFVSGAILLAGENDPDSQPDYNLEDEEPLHPIYADYDTSDSD